MDKTESRIQGECVTWFRNTFPPLRGLLWYTKNEGFKSIREADLDKAMGLQEGVSDLILFLDGQFYGLECKTPTGRQSKPQKKWQALIERNGGLYYIFRSLDEFKAIIIPILDGKYPLDTVKNKTKRPS